MERENPNTPAASPPRSQRPKKEKRKEKSFLQALFVHSRRNTTPYLYNSFPAICRKTPPLHTPSLATPIAPPIPSPPLPSTSSHHSTSTPLTLTPPFTTASFSI